MRQKVLYCFLLRCVVLCGVVLNCIEFYCTVFYCILLYCTVLYFEITGFTWECVTAEAILLFKEMADWQSRNDFEDNELNLKTDFIRFSFLDICDFYLIFKQNNYLAAADIVDQ